jgi:isopentenyl phosphate kinase
MSYDIQLYTTATKKKHLANPSDDFFENEENLESFTAEQREYLKQRLLTYGYVIDKEENGTMFFSYDDDYSASSLLTNNCLYFSSSGDGIFEISMTASEFTDTDEFEKYDPQNGGWEEM